MYTCVYIYTCIIMYYIGIPGFRVYIYDPALPLDLYICILCNIMCTGRSCIFSGPSSPIFKNWLANRRRCKYPPTNYRPSSSKYLPQITLIYKYNNTTRSPLNCIGTFQLDIFNIYYMIIWRTIWYRIAII